MIDRTPGLDPIGDDGAGEPRDPIEAPARSQKMFLSDLSIKQPVFITMMILAVMVVGGMFYSRMGLDLMPDVALPIAVVQTIYPGASPEELERSVTKPIENALISINGVDSVDSTTRDSVSLVVVQFKMEIDGKQAADEVRTRVAAIRNSLPADIQEPVILRFDPTSSPILAFSIADASGTLSPSKLRALATDTLGPRIEQVPGAAGVTVVGGQVEEVHVDLNRAQLESYGIPPQLIIQAIGLGNLDVPAGRVLDGTSESLLRLNGRVQSIAELGGIPIMVRPNGVTIRVRDVAAVSAAFADVRTLSRLDREASVVLNVRKQSGTNTVKVADAVKAEAEQIRQDYPDLTIAIASDQSTFTRQAVDDVQVTLLLGAFLAAVVVLLFFRDLRNTLVTVAGLPVIILGTFAVMYLLGFTLNLITMMALSLSVGMLIDDAIVVRENIFRHVERGEEPKVAAGRGTAEIALAVVAVTSTIVAVFLPIAFTTGLAGRFLRDFGITVAVATLISLVEAFTLAPMLSAYLFRRVEPGQKRRRESAFGRVFGGVNVGYRRLLGWSLRHRLVVVLIGIVVFAASLSVIPLMTTSLLTEMDQGRFGVGLHLAAGSQLGETDNLAQKVEQLLLDDPEVLHVFTTVGSSDGSVETATIDVELRQIGKTNEVITRMEPRIRDIAGGAQVTFDRQSIATLLGGSGMVGSLTSQPIQFAVQGDDFQALDSVSADLVERLKAVQGAISVDRSLRSGEPGRAIVLDRAKASDLGISAAQIGATVRAMVNGERVGTFQGGGQNGGQGVAKDVDIVVRLAEADRGSPADILRLPIVSPGGTQVPLSAVASIVKSTEPDQISRTNRQRLVTVGASYLGRNEGDVQADARAAAAQITLPPGVTISVAGLSQYQDEMFASLGLAGVLAVLFIYMILASQFGSFVHPLTVMLALPFSISGALIALYLGGFNLDMVGLIGMILLMGLVAKNSILLVEFTNQLRRRGLEVNEAILEAGPIRLRPIVMTTLAMILGMAPLAAGLGSGSEMRQPMGVAVIGGLLTSMLLTLVVVPVAYSLIADLTRVVTRRPATAPTAEKVEVAITGN